MPLVAHSSFSSTELKWGLLFIDLGGQGKRLSSWWEVELSAPIPLAGDPDTRTAGRGGLALGPAHRPPPWGTPTPLPLPPLTPLLRPCPSPGGALGQLLPAWIALIFPLLIIRSCGGGKQGLLEADPPRHKLGAQQCLGCDWLGLDTKGSCIKQGLSLYPFREVHSLWLPLLLLLEMLLEDLGSRGLAHTSPSFTLKLSECLHRHQPPALT